MQLPLRYISSSPVWNQAPAHRDEAFFRDDLLPCGDHSARHCRISRSWCTREFGRASCQGSAQAVGRGGDSLDAGSTWEQAIQQKHHHQLLDAQSRRQHEVPQNLQAHRALPGAASPWRQRQGAPTGVLASRRASQKSLRRVPMVEHIRTISSRQSSFRTGAWGVGSGGTENLR